VRIRDSDSLNLHHGPRSLRGHEMKGWDCGTTRNNLDRHPKDVPYRPKTGKDRTKSSIAVRRLLPASAREQ
jgi:hypothetical protein